MGDYRISPNGYTYRCAVCGMGIALNAQSLIGGHESTHTYAELERADLEMRKQSPDPTPENARYFL